MQFVAKESCPQGERLQAGSKCTQSASLTTNHTHLWPGRGGAASALYLKIENRNSAGIPEGNRRAIRAARAAAAGRPQPGPPLRPSPGRPAAAPQEGTGIGPRGRAGGTADAGEDGEGWREPRPAGRQRPRLGALVPTHPAVHHAETERQPLRRGPRLFSSHAHSARRRRHGSREAAAADSKIQPPSLRAMLIGALCQPPSDRLEPRRAC